MIVVPLAARTSTAWCPGVCPGVNDVDAISDLKVTVATDEHVPHGPHFLALQRKDRIAERRGQQINKPAAPKQH